MRSCACGTWQLSRFLRPLHLDSCPSDSCPAEAGVQALLSVVLAEARRAGRRWIPACVGMTEGFWPAYYFVVELIARPKVLM